MRISIHQTCVQCNKMRTPCSVILKDTFAQSHGCGYDTTVVGSFQEQYKFCYSFLNQYIKRGKYCHQSPAEDDRPLAIASTSSPGDGMQRSGGTERGAASGRSSGGGRTSSAKKRLSDLFRSPRHRSGQGELTSAGRKARTAGDSGERDACNSPVNHNRNTELDPGK